MPSNLSCSKPRPYTHLPLLPVLVSLFVFTVKKRSYPTIQPPDKQATFYELFARKKVVLTFKINLPKSVTSCLI
jgi:hypothetical protein